MSLREFLRVLARRWPLIAAVALAAGALTWFASPADVRPAGPASYTAKAVLEVGYKGDPEGVGGGIPLQRLAGYITTGKIPEAVAKKRAFAKDPALLANQVSVVADPQTQFISIETTQRRAEEASGVANDFAQATIDFVKAQKGGGTEVSLLQPATAIPGAPPGTVIPPGRPARTALATALGLLFGLALALLIDRLDSRLRSRQEIQKALGMPIIAEVPKVKRSGRSSVARMVIEQPLSPFAGGYRAARAALVHTLQRSGKAGALAGEVTEGSRAPIILVTSANPSDGKTTSVGNLAASFSEFGRRVLVLDADLRSPDANEALDVPPGAGISDYLVDGSAGELERIIRPTSVPGVELITAGTELEHPTSLASRLGPLLEESRGHADVVIVDSAPLLAASEVFDVLPLVDTVLVVARAGRLSETNAHRMSELLGRFRVPVAGVLLIESKPTRGRKGYGYGYGEAGRTKSKGGSHRSTGRVADETPGPVAEETPGPAPDEQVASRLERPLDQPDSEDSAQPAGH